MGEIEKTLKKRVRRGNIQSAILKTIYAGGLVSVALMAPNALRLLKQLDGPRTYKKQGASRVNEAFNRLVKNGYLTLENTQKGTFVRLSVKGESFLKQTDVSEFFRQKPKKWDKRWRILIFDIKESRKSIREKLRRTLLEIGFLRLQDSVWVFPYDCEDFIILLKADFQIGKDILYIIADSIENDSVIRKHFNLK